jgi:beta-glucanase (GH16 family)
MHLGLCHGNFPEILWDSGGNTDEDFEGRWNTYGLLWEPGRAQWIQNGRIKREVTGPHVPSLPMYVILSNGVSSRFGPSGAPTEETVFPNFFEIDYVRVWTGARSTVQFQTPRELHPGIRLSPAARSASAEESAVRGAAPGKR